MTQEHCIAAIATPHGTGGIAVIRVSGEKAFEIANRVFQTACKKRLSEYAGYTAAYGNFIDRQGDFLDDGVCLIFRAPKSYSGEDCVELSCHGGQAVVRQILRLLFESGAAPAQPGEFTKRAFLNGKLTLTQAEAVSDLIGARSEMALKAANSARQGAVYRKIRQVCDLLVSADGHLQAWLDYPEEDIEQVQAKSMQTLLENASGELGRLLERFDDGQQIKNGVCVAIIGKPNVGKSTLMNLLTGFETSIVTDISGTTRDIVEQTVEIDGVTLLLSDTAGIRDTQDPVEKIGVNKAKDAIEKSSLLLAMFDSSRDLEEVDFELIERAKRIPSIAVVNKTDCGTLDLKEKEKAFEKVVYTSKEDLQSIERLKKAIAEVCHLKRFDSGAAMLANERQKLAAQSAKDKIDQALDDLKGGMTWDAIGVALDSALDDLLELTGEKASDAVIEQVFSQFCVGK